MRVVAPAVVFAFLLAGGTVALQCYDHVWKDCAKENCLVENNKKDCGEHDVWCRKYVRIGRFALNN